MRVISSTLCIVKDSWKEDIGLETLLSDADKKVYRKEISKGYKDFAFNEFLSKSVAVGINSFFL